MFPILFHSGFITIYSFGLFAAAAFLVGSFTFWELARKQSVPMDQTFDGLIIGVIAGLLGARFLFVLFHFNLFWPNLLQGVNLLYHPGFVWWGALAAGTVSLLWYYRSQDMLVGPVLDKAVVAISLAQSIGLIGAFLAGSAYGAKTASVVGINVVGLVGKRYPVQLLEALVDLGLFVLCLHLVSRPHKKGYVALLYVFLYALARIFIEFFRGDSVYWAGIRVQWVFCAVAIAACIFLSSRRHNRQATAHAPSLNNLQSTVKERAT